MFSVKGKGRIAQDLWPPQNDMLHYPGSTLSWQKEVAAISRIKALHCLTTSDFLNSILKLSGSTG
jgi:hypothetical protein